MLLESNRPKREVVFQLELFSSSFSFWLHIVGLNVFRNYLMHWHVFFSLWTWNQFWHYFKTWGGQARYPHSDCNTIVIGAENFGWIRLSASETRCFLVSKTSCNEMHQESFCDISRNPRYKELKTMPRCQNRKTQRQTPKFWERLKNRKLVQQINRNFRPWGRILNWVRFEFRLYNLGVDWDVFVQVYSTFTSWKLFCVFVLDTSAQKTVDTHFFKMTSTFVFRCRFEGSFDDASDALLEVQCSPDVSWSNDGAGWMMGGSRGVLFGNQSWPFSQGLLKCVEPFFRLGSLAKQVPWWHSCGNFSDVKRCHTRR